MLELILSNYFLLVSFVLFVSLSLGSFAGMLVYRIPNKKPIMSLSERSVCVTCNHELKWLHNIPILSYIVLKGKCCFCKGNISPHYFLVELITVVSLTFTFVYFQSGIFDYQLSYSPYINTVLSHNLTHTLSMMFFVYILIVLGAIDIMTGYLPDKLTYTGMGFAIAVSFVDPTITWQDSIIGMCVGYGSLWIIAKSFLFFRGVDGMGHGDFKMLAMIGAFLGWQSLAFIPLLASVVAILFASIALATNKNKNKQTEFPFGQYLALSALLMVFVNSNVVLYYTNLH